MTNLYCTATHTGKGFFTHQDRNDFYLSGHAANVWVIGDSTSCPNCGASVERKGDSKGAAWIKKVNGTLKTKAEAQALIDAEIEKAQVEWEALPEEQKDGRTPPSTRPEKYTLP